MISGSKALEASTGLLYRQLEEVRWSLSCCREWDSREPIDGVSSSWARSSHAKTKQRQDRSHIGGGARACWWWAQSIEETHGLCGVSSEDEEAHLIMWDPSTMKSSIKIVSMRKFEGFLVCSQKTWGYWPQGGYHLDQIMCCSTSTVPTAAPLLELLPLLEKPFFQLWSFFFQTDRFLGAKRPPTKMASEDYFHRPSAKIIFF